MANDTDFTWQEVGRRIREQRLRLGLSQYALATACGLTQNCVYRVESGETNPQLATLREIAKVLGYSVRALIAGGSDSVPGLEQRYRRVRRIVESDDAAALTAMDAGLQTAELLLDRSGRRTGLPPQNVKAKGRQIARASIWVEFPDRRRSESHRRSDVDAVLKAR